MSLLEQLVVYAHILEWLDTPQLRVIESEAPKSWLDEGKHLYSCRPGLRAETHQH